MISFIIPAHNEQCLLGATLTALSTSAEAIAGPFEIIVVDDTSTDHTAKIAQAHGAQVVRVELRHIAAVRNAGARAAGGEILIFVDADTIVTEAVLRAAVLALNEGAVGGGASVHLDQRLPLLTRMCVATFLILYRFGGWATGCFVFVRRDAFEAVGGFDEQYFAGEEWFLSRALKRRGRFVLLREPVITSARKVQQHTNRWLFRTLIRLSLKGPKGMRTREGLEFWYGSRPDASAGDAVEESPTSRV